MSTVLRGSWQCSLARHSHDESSIWWRNVFQEKKKQKLLSLFFFFLLYCSLLSPYLSRSLSRFQQNPTLSWVSVKRILQRASGSALEALVNNLISIEYTVAAAPTRWIPQLISTQPTVLYKTKNLYRERGAGKKLNPLMRRFWQGMSSSRSLTVGLGGWTMCWNLGPPMRHDEINRYWREKRGTLKY